MLRNTGLAALLHKFWVLTFSIAVAVSGVLALPAQGQTAEPDITGMPEVIDADIIRFGQQRVILWGVDAPERPQLCHANGAIWGCYEAAVRKLQLLAGRGEVSCYYKGEPDPFGRHYAICTSAGEDLNAELVKSGLALAFEEQSDEYFPQMAEAIAAGIGLWQVGVTFEEPWIFRKRETRGGYR